MHKEEMPGSLSRYLVLWNKFITHCVVYQQMAEANYAQHSLRHEKRRLLLSDLHPIKRTLRKKSLLL